MKLSGHYQELNKERLRLLKRLRTSYVAVNFKVFGIGCAIAAVLGLLPGTNLFEGSGYAVKWAFTGAAIMGAVVSFIRVTQCKELQKEISSEISRVEESLSE